MRRSYAGGAKTTTLTAVLNGTTGDLTIQCTDLSNYPTGASGPFYVVIDRGLVSEEKILCSSRTGNTLSVYNTGLVTGRGADGTTVSSHAIGAELEHIFTATDADEANAHVNDTTTNVHPQYLFKSAIDAKGDLLVGTADNTVSRLPVGSNGQVLVADSTASTGVKWAVNDGATGGGTNKVFFENDLTISEDYTVTTSKNAGTFGPVSIDSGVTVTIPSGSVWTVV